MTPNNVIPNSPEGSGQATVPINYYGNTNKYGEYSYVSLNEIINNFVAAYVGEGKILENVLKADVSYHAHRALQELSYDTIKSCKSQEIEVCPNLKMPLPHDYVNYVKVASVNSNGIEQILYPAQKTSNPVSIEQTQGNCTDCGDSSDSYLFGETTENPDGTTTTNPNLLKPQTEDCGTSTVTCAMDVSALESNSHLGANQVFQALAEGSSLEWYSVEQKIGYWRLWQAAVDSYCVCLQRNGSEDNCGSQNPRGWHDFDLVNSGRTNVTAEVRDRGGWLGLQNNTNPVVNRTAVVNGTLPSLDLEVTLTTPTSNSWANYKAGNNNQVAIDQSTSTNLAVDTDNYFQNTGERYGIDPQHSQANGSYFIDCLKGMIHFSSNLSGKTVVLKYISDGLGSDKEMIIPKLAEEAMYKWIAYGCASARLDVPEFVIQRIKREKFAETRKAKLRLSNIKLEEITQIIRGRSKWIKH